MDELQYLLAGAQLEDSLLQSYRQLSMTLQSIFLLIGTLLITVIIPIPAGLELYSLEILFIIIFCLSMYSSRKFYLVIKHRANDVNFWHKKVMLAETEPDSKMTVFTEFKIWQKYKRANNDYLLNDGTVDKKDVRENVDFLIGKGEGHTRRVVDRYITFGIIIAWWMLFIIAASKVLLTS